MSETGDVGEGGCCWRLWGGELEVTARPGSRDGVSKGGWVGDIGRALDG